MVWRHKVLRQDYVIAPDSFDIFLAVKTVTCDGFSIDKGVVDDFIRIATTGGRTKDELVKVLRAVLNADDASIAPRSHLSLVKATIATIEVCSAFGLDVAEKKAVTIYT